MDPGRLKTLCRLLAFVFATACLVARPLVPGPNVHGGVDFFLGLWVLFAYFFLLLGMLLDGEVRIPIPGVGGMLALLAAFAFLSVTWSARKISALEHASELLALAALYGTVMAFEAKERAILARCFLAVATAVAVCAIYQYFIGLPELRRVLELHPERIPVEKALLGDYLSRLNTDRAFATLLYPNALAGYLLIAIPVGLGILAQRISGLKMRGWVAVVEVGAVALVGYGLILTFSKGGWVAATAGLLVFGILAAKFAGRLDGRRLAWLGAAAAFLAVVVYTGGRAGVLPRPGEYIASSRVRAEYAGVAVAMIRDNSWIGVGAGGFGDHYARYKTPEAEETQKAHNNFLQVAAELGVGGLLVFAGMWVVFLSGVVRSFRAGSKNPISDETDSPSAGSLRGAACIAGLMAFLIGAMWGMDEPLVRMWSLMTFAAVAAAGVFGNGVTDGPYVRAGAAAGAVGFFVHNFADFDWYVPAVAQAGLVVMALSRPSPRRFVRVRIGRAVAAAAVMGGAVVLGFLCCVVYPRLLTARFAQEEAEAHMREGKVAEAVACLERAAAANPLDDEIAFERAGACATLGRRTGDRARALSGFERAIALDPVKSVYHFTLAEFVGEDDPVTALSEYRAAARLYPAKPIYHLELAKALERAGNAAEAIAEYRETLRLHGAVTVKRLRLEAADARFVRERIAALEGEAIPAMKSDIRSMLWGYFVIPLAVLAAGIPLVLWGEGAFRRAGKGQRIAASFRVREPAARLRAVMAGARDVRGDPRLARDPVVARAFLDLLREELNRKENPPRRNPVAETAALALSRMGVREAAGIILGALADAASPTRKAFIEILADIGEKSDAMKLLPYLADTSPDVRKMTAYVIGMLGEPAALLPLEGLLADPVEDVRWNAALALARNRRGSGLAVIATMLDRRHLNTVPGMTPAGKAMILTAALRAVGMLRESSFADVVRDLSRGDPDETVRKTAGEVLRQLE